MTIASIIPLGMLWPYLLGLAVFIIVVSAISIWLSERESAEDEKEKIPYKYVAKKSFITAAERGFYNALGQAVGKDYRIFAQVHLGSILDERVPGQDWRAARAHINRKSVDFLLCDKDYLTPILAIELDDSSHERQDRKERDIEVERILKEVNLPLLRVQNSASFDPQMLANQVKNIVSQR